MSFGLEIFWVGVGAFHCPIQIGRGCTVPAWAMDDGWPGVDPVVLLTLQRFFRSPLSLQAAFDDEEGCTQFTQSLFLTWLMRMSGT